MALLVPLVVLLLILGMVVSRYGPGSLLAIPVADDDTIRFVRTLMNMSAIVIFLWGWFVWKSIRVLKTG